MRLTVVDIDKTIKWLDGEWSVIAHAPVIFLASILVVGLLIWRIGQWQYGSQLTSSKAIVSLRDTQLQDYKDKLSGASPDEARARMDALETRIDEILPQIAALSPKKITTEQRQLMAPFLDRFPGCSVSIASDAVSADAAQMSKGLITAFNASRWLVQTPVIMGIANPPPTGVALCVADPGNLSEEQKAIADAFTSAAIAFDFRHGGAIGALQPWPVAEIMLTTRRLD